MCVNRAGCYLESKISNILLFPQVLIEDHSSQNQVLRQQILEKENKINELETNLDRLRCETPNTTEILATIESDKVAASRAVAQNQALKQQLDEIQNAYVHVVSVCDCESNDSGD